MFSSNSQNLLKPFVTFLFLSNPFVVLNGQVACVPFSFDRSNIAWEDDFDSGDFGEWIFLDENRNQVDPAAFGWSVDSDNAINFLEDPKINKSVYSLHLKSVDGVKPTTLLSPEIDLRSVDPPGLIFYSKSDRGLDNIDMYVIYKDSREKVFPANDNNPAWCDCNDTWTGQFVDLSDYEGKTIQIEIVPKPMPGESFSLDYFRVCGGGHSQLLSVSGLVVLGLMLMFLGVRRL